MRIPDRALTHGGKFHADDVLSSALLRLLNPSIQFQRVFTVPEGYDGLVFDIGYGRFDHHQRDAEVRPNGVPYAAFGLLWRELGEGLLGAEEAVRFDEHFVQPVDRDDNTGCGCLLAELIGNFNPGWDSQESPDDCFEQAVCFATLLLQKKIAAIQSIGRARELVSHALGQMRGGIVVLPRFAPWKMVLVGSGAQFVVYPSGRGGYSAQGVPQQDGGALKYEFPLEWAGKQEAELRALSGIPTLRFCHNNRFLIAADTLEDAISACRLARGAGAP